MNKIINYFKNASSNNLQIQIPPQHCAVLRRHALAFCARETAEGKLESIVARFAKRHNAEGQMTKAHLPQLSLKNEAFAVSNNDSMLRSE